MEYPQMTQIGANEERQSLRRAERIAADERGYTRMKKGANSYRRRSAFIRGSIFPGRSSELPVRRDPQPGLPRSVAGGPPESSLQFGKGRGSEYHVPEPAESLHASPLSITGMPTLNVHPPCDDVFENEVPIRRRTRSRCVFLGVRKN